MTDSTTQRSQPATTRLPVPGLIVAPAWLGQHLNQPMLRLLDLRPRKSYDEGHLPGAAWLDLEALDCEVDGVPGMLLPRDSFARKMSQLGVGQGNAVVIYDDNWGMPAARVLWALARYGHPNAAVLTGGSDRWQEEGLAWTREPFEPRPAHFIPQPDDDHVAERTWLLVRLGDPDVVLLDTRAPGEYFEGHLPSAICWDWVNGLPQRGWDTLRPAEELRAELSSLGVTPDKQIVTYCRSGMRAAHTYLLLRSLGYQQVRLYDGSWLEWSRYHNVEGGAH